MSNPTITVAALKTKINLEIWPSGAPENNLASISSFYIAALMELQKFIPCLQINNTNIFPHCSTFFNCGKTFVDAPYGIIKRVWTIANDDYCNRVDYRVMPMSELEDWSKNLLCFDVPLSSGLPSLPMGDRYASDSVDHVGGRSRTGIWAQFRKRIYVAPWLQSNETLILEWDGVKSDWTDADLLDRVYWTPKAELAIKLYVKWSYERDFGKDPSERAYLKAAYDAEVADLMHTCKQNTQARDDEGSVKNYNPSGATVLAEAVSTDVPTTVIGVIGNYGGGAMETEVSSLVKGWTPAAIMTTGGNCVTTDTLAHLDDAIGQFYQDYIFPYVGSYGVGAAANKFWPALGRNEVSGTALDLFKEYFLLPNNERYYDVIVGNVHFFVINSGLNVAGANQEADGITSTSTQGKWLQAKLATSTAKWKVVICHVPPHSSGSLYGSVGVNWDFKSWGADAVISGSERNYERIMLNDFPFFVNGLGGIGLGTLSALVTGSAIASIFNYGAMKITATCNSITFEFFEIDGTPIDSYTISA